MNEDYQKKIDAITEQFDDKASEGCVKPDCADCLSCHYDTLHDVHSDFKYGLLYGNFDRTGEYDDKPLVSQDLFEFGCANNIPMILSRTNPYGKCTHCNAWRP